MGKRKTSPSRIRYETAHPVVTLRLTREDRERLMAVMAGAGLSAAEWVKLHLDQDDVRSAAIARRLAEEKDGLGQQLEETRSELRRVSLLVVERSHEAEVSVAELKQKLLAEARAAAEVEHNRRVKELEKEFQSLRLSAELRLLDLEDEIEAKKKELASVEGQLKAKRGELWELDLKVKNREGTIKELAEAATRRAQQEGAPLLYCVLNCQAYALFRSLEETVKGCLKALPPSASR